MPSEKHTEMIRRGLCWLSNISTQKGIRGCNEVILGEGYVADGAAIMNLQFKWQKSFGVDKREIPMDDFTFILESKVSKSDLRKTFVHKNHIGDRTTPKANFHILCCSHGVLDTHLSDEIGLEVLPDFWGVLEESRNGVRLIRHPKYCPQPIESIYEFGYRILRYSDSRKFMIINLKEVAEDNTQLTLTP